jgi:GNAT superfamily N-acetyltransferase
VPHPGHQLAGAGTGRDGQGGRGVPQVVEAKPRHAGCSGGWPPDPSLEVAAAQQLTLRGREHQPLRAGLTVGETFVVWDDDNAPAATITINRWAKPELWTPEEAAEPAPYAHKVTVDRAYGGQGLGAELLDWAGSKAADEGDDWLRVDVWTTNERLQHYYLRQGFTYVRTVVLPHNPSGALFQRPAERVPTSHLQEVESLTG